jgi:hypothetical protein
VAGRLSVVDGVTPGWSLLGVAIEGSDFEVAGINVWEHGWEPVGSRAITVAHPTYPDQRHQMWVYRLYGVPTPVVFAAGEFSNGVWGFYAADP